MRLPTWWAAALLYRIPVVRWNFGNNSICKMPFGLLFLVFGFCFFTKAQNLYEVSLTSCSQDQITILFRPEPTVLKDTLVFSFPATVPGTYDTQNYGRFVTSLMAYTEQHIPLKIKRKGPNRWFIYNAKQLHHIRYEVEDIMDKKIASHPIFQPAATAFKIGRAHV